MALMNIGTAPDLIVPVVFTGSNTIGPQLTMSLPKVLITPNKAFDLISVKLSSFEVDGQVQCDVITGSFGTVLTPDGLISPAVENYYDGSGIVTIGGRDVGNVSKFSFHLSVKHEDHKTSRVGRKRTDFSYVTDEDASVSMTLDEFTFDNLILMLLAEAA